MFPICVNSKPHLLGVFALSVLVGCASSPTVEQAAPPPASAAVEPQSAPVPAEAQQGFDEALSLIGAGQFDQAEQRLQALSSAYPDYVGPWLNLGILRVKAKRYADAEIFFKSALERDARSTVAYNYLGIVYRNLGRFKDAEAAYQQALSIDDNYALAHLNLGVLCDLYLQQPERALAEFQRYLELSATPEPKVAAWVKELQRRAGSNKPTNGAAPASTETAEGAKS